MKIIMLCLAIALTALACSNEPPGPGPDPTQPPPAPTEVVEPVETPVPFVPCVAVPPDPGVWKGDCEVNDDCRTNADGTYSGKCHTKVPS